MCNLWLEIHLTHSVKKRTVVANCLSGIVINLQSRSEPVRYRLYLLFLSKPGVNQNYIAVVLLMSYNSAKRLIGCPGCLLAVPFLACQSVLLKCVQVMPFQYRLRVQDHRVWNSNQHDAPGRIITKVKPFADLAATNREHNRSFTVYILVESLYYEFVMRAVSWLLIDAFYSLKSLRDADTVPSLIKLY